MTIKSKWVEKKMSVLTNNRGHNAVVDLPEGKKGTDSACTALELTLMSLGGCITTIYAIIAENKKVNLYDMEVEIEAEQDKQTINAVHITADILTDASKEDATNVFENTLKSCPVGVLFDRAGVTTDYTLQIHSPEYK